MEKTNSEQRTTKNEKRKTKNEKAAERMEKMRELFAGAAADLLIRYQ